MTVINNVITPPTGASLRKQMIVMPIPTKAKRPKRTQKPTVIFHSPFSLGDKKSSLMNRERRGVVFSYSEGAMSDD